MSKDIWLHLRKGAVSLHLSYGNTFTNNLSATDLRTCASDVFEFSFDLNKNLRTRNKLNFSYVDARELADGKIKKLKVVQINDKGVIERIGHRLQGAGKKYNEWLLRVYLEGEHLFRVRPELKKSGAARSLFLHVVASQENHILPE